MDLLKELSSFRLVNHWRFFICSRADSSYTETFLFQNLTAEWQRTMETYKTQFYGHAERDCVNFFKCVVFGNDDRAHFVRFKLRAVKPKICPGSSFKVRSKIATWGRMKSKNPPTWLFPIPTTKNRRHLLNLLYQCFDLDGWITFDLEGLLNFWRSCPLFDPYIIDDFLLLTGRFDVY